MERKIGEIFKVGDEWYQCVNGFECIKCDLCQNERCKTQYNDIGPCSKNARKNNVSVIFKKLEKTEEPYEYYIKGIGIITVQEYILENSNYIWEYNQDVFVTDCSNGKIAIEIKQNKDMEDNKLNLNPFDIQKAREGKAVCTRDGRRVRILCFDAKRKDEKSIIALVPSKDYPGFEDLIAYPDNGNYYGGHENDGDLMMPTERKEGWVNVYNDAPIYDTKERAELAASTVKKRIGTFKISWEE